MWKKFLCLIGKHDWRYGNYHKAEQIAWNTQACVRCSKREWCIDYLDANCNITYTRKVPLPEEE